MLVMDTAKLKSAAMNGYRTAEEEEALRARLKNRNRRKQKKTPLDSDGSPQAASRPRKRAKKNKSNADASSPPSQKSTNATAPTGLSGAGGGPTGATPPHGFIYGGQPGVPVSAVLAASGINGVAGLGGLPDLNQLGLAENLAISMQLQQQREQLIATLAASGNQGLAAAANLNPAIAACLQGPPASVGTAASLAGGEARSGTTNEGPSPHLHQTSPTPNEDALRREQSPPAAPPGLASPPKAPSAAEQQAVSGSRASVAPVPPPPRPVPPPPPRPYSSNGSPRTEDLYLDMDADVLSDHQILVRKQIEFFVCGEEDIKNFTPGRRRELSVGQVGIRCKSCAHLEPHERPRGTVYFPSTLRALYQAAQNMASVHFTDTCKNISPQLKQKFIDLRERKAVCGHGGKKYWSEGAIARGVYETDLGLRFRELPPPSLPPSTSV